MRVARLGHQVQLTYDALGQRLHRIETGPGGARHALYPSAWAEVRDGALVRLVRGAGPDGVVAEVAPAHVPADGVGPHGNTTTVLHDDGLGNLVHGEPAGHALVFPGVPTPGDKRRYEAFGTIRSETGSIGGPAAVSVERGFAGLVPDGDTGLLYARARHYEPERRSCHASGSRRPCQTASTRMSVFEKLVVDDVGKAAELCAARLAVYLRPDLRVPLDLCDAGLEALHERGAES